MREQRRSRGLGHQRRLAREQAGLWGRPAGREGEALGRLPLPSPWGLEPPSQSSPSTLTLANLVPTSGCESHQAWSGDRHPGGSRKTRVAKVEGQTPRR